MPLLGSILIATSMVILTVVLHYAGLVILLALLRNRRRRTIARPHLGQGAAILFVVLCIMALHSLEIWLYAGLYLAVGTVPDFQTALYFSTASFTTIGYGDVVVEPPWRLVSAIEGANGLLLFGWSTAFLTRITSQLSTLDHDWI